jgi:hypothetical protein
MVVAASKSLNQPLAPTHFLLGLSPLLLFREPVHFMSNETTQHERGFYTVCIQNMRGLMILSYFFMFSHKFRWKLRGD